MGTGSPTSPPILLYHIWCMAVWETWLLVNALADLLYRQLPFYSTEGHVKGKIQLYTVPVVLDCSSSTRELPKNDIKTIFYLSASGVWVWKLLPCTIWPYFMKEMRSHIIVTLAKHELLAHVSKNTDSPAKQSSLWGPLVREVRFSQTRLLHMMWCS